MKRFLFIISVLIGAAALFSACSSKTKPTSGSNEVQPAGGPTSALQPCIIYKTKGDYANLVPVILSDDKTRIVSYPGVSDIVKQGDRVYPVDLGNGFLLDNRGIGPNVAFLDISYEEYSTYSKTPSVNKLFEHLLDADPLVVMYQCGVREDNPGMVSKLKEMVQGGTFSSCKQLK